ncbi:MAG: TIR domain-containing protein [Cyanobacteria bacterium P01_C01_bin.118]
MTDVFISYSRKDKAFVQVLNQALANSKYDAWVDWENIPLTADWWEEIKAGIEGADTFIFVISPDSIASNVCGQEIDHAVENNKRLLPIVYREGFDMSLVRPALGKHNWLFFKEDNDFGQAFASLVETLNTDLSHVKTHTRLLVRALEWEKKHRSDDFLLRGSDLGDAEKWLSEATSVLHEPLPTEQHKNYVTKSREVEDARQRLTAAGEKAKRLVRTGAGVLAGTIAIATVIGIFTQRNAYRNHKLALIEQDSINALQQFEYQQLDALLQAMKAAENLKNLTSGGDKPLREYVPQSAPRVLQQILDQISQKNAFTNGPEAVPGEVLSAKFSPDGNTLVITGVDGKVMLKTPQGIDTQQIHGHFSKIWQADFSPDGQGLGTTSDVFRLFDATGTLVKTLEHPSGITGRILFSPDGEYIAISGWEQDNILVLDRSGTPLTTLKAKAVNRIDWHPEKPILASASSNGTVELWNARDNNVNILEGHDRFVKSVKFSPNGDFLISGSADESVRLWDLNTGESTIIDYLQGWVLGLDFHPDGQQFVAASSGGIAKLWDLEGNIIQSFSGHAGTINSVGFSPDGHMLITTADDGQVRVWSLKGKEVVELERHTGVLWNADIRSDGNHIATASVDGTTRIWDLSGQEVQRLELPDENFNNVVFRPDGDSIVTSTHQGNVQLWDTDGTLINSFRLHTSRVLGLAISPNGQYGVSGSLDATAKIWDLEGNVLATVAHDNEEIRDVAFSPDGQSFATASEDSLARLWDLEGNLLMEFQGHADGVNGIDFSPDGTMLVTGSDDSTVKFWNMQGEIIRSFQKHHGRVWTIEFSPDGQSIATGTSDGYARLWDSKGNLISEFKVHDNLLTSVNFSPDGKHLVTTTADGEAKVWQVVQTLDDLLTQGCEWLADYLRIHPDVLMDLESCHSPKQLKQAAPHLVEQGDLLAKAGDSQQAIANYRTAQAWDADLAIEPRIRAQQFTRIGEAEALAQTGDVDVAITTYQQALELDTRLDLDPEQEVKRIAVLALMQKGLESAEAGDAATAETAFLQAKTIDPTLEIEPTTKAQELAVNNLLASGKELIDQRKIEAAIAAFEKAQAIDPEVTITADTWDQLCWQGSLWGYAQQVLAACERSVVLAPQNSNMRNARGLAKALTGDFDSAIADFEFYIKHSNDEEARSQRQQWIEFLKSDENPFTPEVLERLQ